MSTELCFNWHHRFISKQLKPISLNPLGLLKLKTWTWSYRALQVWPFIGQYMVCNMTCQWGGDNLNTFPYRSFINSMIGDREEKVFAQRKGHGLDHPTALLYSSLSFHFIWCLCLVFQHACILCNIYVCSYRSMLNGHFMPMIHLACMNLTV